MERETHNLDDMTRYGILKTYSLYHEGLNSLREVHAAMEKKREEGFLREEEVVSLRTLKYAVPILVDEGLLSEQDYLKRRTISKKGKAVLPDLDRKMQGPSDKVFIAAQNVEHKGKTVGQFGDYDIAISGTTIFPQGNYDMPAVDNEGEKVAIPAQLTIDNITEGLAKNTIEYLGKKSSETLGFDAPIQQGHITIDWKKRRGGEETEQE